MMSKRERLFKKAYETSVKIDRFPKDVKFNANGVKEIKSIPGCLISLFIYLLVLLFAMQKFQEMINR